MDMKLYKSPALRMARAKELELTCTRYEPEAAQALRDDIDLKKWAVNQSAGQHIRSHEAVQRISIRRQLHDFMQVSGDALAAALAPELLNLSEQPDIVRERALDRAAASVREALSVHITRGGNIDYAEEDRDILTTIGFRPDRASGADNRANIRLNRVRFSCVDRPRRPAKNPHKTPRKYPFF
ncbi:phage polarity suppression protein [Citrobacter freundii]|uniref:phage polarity suppression protein n=1 Tax=Citrobacter freundii TaxID=546 RepID=UPI00358DC521